MNNNQFIDLALNTECDYAGALERLQDPKLVRLLHAGMGLSTEANEVVDNLKKHIFYGKPLNEINLKEEAGDIFWYLAIISKALKIPFDEIMATVIAKLKVRYPNKFTEKDAIERNLNAELNVLENNNSGF